MSPMPAAQAQAAVRLVTILIYLDPAAQRSEPPPSSDARPAPSRADLNPAAPRPRALFPLPSKRRSPGAGGSG